MQKSINGSGGAAAAAAAAGGGKLQQSEQPLQNGLAIQASSKKRKASADEQVPIAAPHSKSKKAKSQEASQALEDGRQDAAHCSSSGHPAAEAAPLKRKGKKAGRKALKGGEEGAGEVTTQPQQHQQKQKARVIHVVSAAEAPALAQFEATPRVGWWGARRFASAGKPPAHPRC